MSFCIDVLLYYSYSSSSCLSSYISSGANPESSLGRALPENKVLFTARVHIRCKVEALTYKSQEAGSYAESWEVLFFSPKY